MSSECTRVDGQGKNSFDKEGPSKGFPGWQLPPYEYIRGVKKLCRSKLNGGNLIGNINTWAVGVVRYSAGMVDWTMEEMASMERRTRKNLAINGCLHTKSNVARG